MTALHALLVDPNPSSGPSLAKALEATGKATVESVMTAIEALVRLRRRTPSLVVVDAEIRVRGGKLLLAEVARDFPDLPLVAVGPRQADAVLATLDAGASLYLARPIHDPRKVAGQVVGHAERRARSELLAGIRETWEAEVEGLRRRLEEARSELRRKDDSFRELEEVLRKDLERLLLVFDAVSDGVVFADREGRVLLMNPAAGAHLGFSPLRAVGASLAEVGVDRGVGPALGRLIREVAEAGGGARTVAAEDGRRFRLQALPLEESVGGDLRGFLALTRDVTAEVLADESLARTLLRAARELRRTATRLRRPRLGRVGLEEAAQAANRAAATLRSLARQRRPGAASPASSENSLVASVP